MLGTSKLLTFAFRSLLVLPIIVIAWFSLAEPYNQAGRGRGPTAARRRDRMGAGRPAHLRAPRLTRQGGHRRPNAPLRPNPGQRARAGGRGHRRDAQVGLAGRHGRGELRTAHHCGRAPGPRTGMGREIRHARRLGPAGTEPFRRFLGPGSARRRGFMVLRLLAAEGPRRWSGSNASKRSRALRPDLERDRLGSDAPDLS